MSFAEPVRFSRLKLMAKSALHFHEGTAVEGGPIRKGTGLHAYMLGGAERVVVYGGGRRDKRVKAWQEFQAEHVDKHILIPSELESVEGMRRSLEGHSRAMALLDGLQERRITWTYDGIPCAGTPDVVLPFRDCVDLVELKTCESSKPDWFFKRARNYGYHGQVDWYSHGVTHCSQYKVPRVRDHYIVAVESTKPWPVTVIHLNEQRLLRGRQLWRGWWEHMKVCEQSNSWPAYAQTDVEWGDDSDDFGLQWGDAAE